MGRLEYRDMGYIATYRTAVHIPYNGEWISATDYNGNIIDVLAWEVNHTTVYISFINRRPVDYDERKNKPVIGKYEAGYDPLPYQFATMQEAIDAAEAVSKRIRKKR